MNPLPRNEYPRPQFRRDEWLCLNGSWEFEIDRSDSGLERGLLTRPLDGRITVPFCPESKLSGIGDRDFLNAVWYRRRIRLPADWAGRRALLHFQAVDHDATVWADGVEVARHRGGWSGFTADLGEVPHGGRAVVIVVRARDDHRAPNAKGKQSSQYHNYQCFYHRTTGIWQTVWAEPVPLDYLGRARITPDLPAGRFLVDLPVQLRKQGSIDRDGRAAVCASIRIGDEVVATASAAVGGQMMPSLVLDIPESKQRPWSCEDPFLYDLDFTLEADGQTIDRVASYAGLRSVSIRDQAVLLNGRPVFQRLVLDQGYYPDGLMTAPSDEALVHDIEIAQEAGFNGARLHQKVCEERFLYHADRLGYLCWGEYGDWGIDRDNPPATYITQWLEILERDYAHPSIVGWCPLNETWNVPLTDRIDGLDDLTRGMYLATKSFDPTRPVVDSSGGAHRVPWTDIYDAHEYEQDPEAFARLFADLPIGQPLDRVREGEPERSVAYAGGPYFVSEFGGTWWRNDANGNHNGRDANSWGYGQRPRNKEEVYRRFEGLCQCLLDDPRIFGYCYTQLTDVFQEENGLFTFERRPKFDMLRLAAVQTQVAAIERETELAAEVIDVSERLKKPSLAKRRASIIRIPQSPEPGGTLSMTGIGALRDGQTRRRSVDQASAQRAANPDQTSD